MNGEEKTAIADKKIEILHSLIVNHHLSSHVEHQDKVK